MIYDGILVSTRDKRNNIRASKDSFQKLISTNLKREIRIKTKLCVDFKVKELLPAATFKRIEKFMHECRLKLCKDRTSYLNPYVGPDVIAAQKKYGLFLTIL